MSTKTIHFVTSNQKKLEEFYDAIGPILNIQFDHSDLKIPKYQGKDSQEVVTEKCKYAVELLKSPVIVEYTSLCFNALNGLPGPYTEAFLTNIHVDGNFIM
jgi:inosine triphosphate pyrophosphatase